MSFHVYAFIHMLVARNRDLGSLENQSSHDFGTWTRRAGEPPSTKVSVRPLEMGAHCQDW